MRDYLTFESEFDRLKGLFLLEGADDDLAEGTNADSENDEGSKEDKSGDSGDDLGLDGGNGGDTDGGEEGGDDGEPASDDIDLDGDSDLGDLTGNPGDAPDAGEVNAENAPPGAINPKTLLQEMSTGEDNIYTRVVKAVKEKFPGGKCQVKDLMVPIVHAVKAYMKNKNYAPISKEAMKAICINVARTIHDQGMKNAQKRSTVESAVYFKKAPYLESQELMEGWKELLLAGTLGASSAMGATAQSAPSSTLHGTPNYDNQSTTYMASVPASSNPANVHFNPNATYDMTQEEFATYKAAGNLPDHYIVSDGKTKSKPAGSGQVKQGSGSQTQKAVKNQAKSGKTTKKIAKSGSDSGDEKCHAPIPEEPVDLHKAAHDLGHKAVDVGLQAAEAGYEAGKQGLKSLWSGLKKGWKKGWGSGEQKNERHHEGL